MKRETVNLTVLLLLVVIISFLFFQMIKGFLMVLLMAALLAALLRPAHLGLSRLLRGRPRLAAVLTIVLLFVLILIPLGLFLGLVTAEAIKIGNSVGPWVSAKLAHPDELSQALQELAIYQHLEPYRDELLTKAGELAGSISTFLVNSLSSATRGTVHFFFLLFLMLYALFFFLVDGERILERILFYLPLEDRDEERMLERFTSVSRATLKGTLLIGVIQGAAGGVGFAVAGIDGAAFWGTIMVVLSIIPVVGASLIWIPAVVILAMNGEWVTAAVLAAYFVLFVGTIDNVLRPRLVGRDTKMSDLLILLSTLGGLSLFGAMGFVIGPIVAALFVTIWEIYGETFKDVLPPVRGAIGGD